MSAAAAVATDRSGSRLAEIPQQTLCRHAAQLGSAAYEVATASNGAAARASLVRSLEKTRGSAPYALGIVSLNGATRE